MFVGLGVCTEGLCTSGCWVDGQFYSADAPFGGMQDCDICTPSQSRTSLTTGPCGDEGIPGTCSGTGVCVLLPSPCTAPCQTCSVTACSGYSCYGVPNPGVSCPDDGNPCTLDVCNSSGECGHPAAPNGTSCGSGLTCTNGVCG
jgi:hypothetical protein